MVAVREECVACSVTDRLGSAASPIRDLPNVRRGDRVALPQRDILPGDIGTEVTRRCGRSRPSTEIHGLHGCTLSGEERLELLIFRERSGDCAAQYEHGEKQMGEPSEHYGASFEGLEVRGLVSGPADYGDDPRLRNELYRRSRVTRRAGSVSRTSLEDLVPSNRQHRSRGIARRSPRDTRLLLGAVDSAKIEH